MILSSAQTKPETQSIKENLEDHYRMIRIGADNGVDLMVFPEMSITGYFRNGVSEFAFTPNDNRLDNLRVLSAVHKIIVIAGAPIRIESKIYIGSFIFKPDSTSYIYTKQFLHPGEEEFFTASFDYNPMIKFNNERVSLAICADIDTALHAETAAKNSATIYLPSIFFSKRSMDACHKSLSQNAHQYGINILMSNYCGQLWGTEAGGRSAFWSSNGKLIAELTEDNPGLLLISKNENSWTGKMIFD